MALKNLGLRFLGITSNTTRKETWKLKGHGNVSLSKRAFRISILTSFNNSIGATKHLSPASEISFVCMPSPNHAFVCLLLSLTHGSFLFVLTGGNLLR